MGLLGFGSLGRFLARALAQDPALELAAVWNRTPTPRSPRSSHTSAWSQKINNLGRERTRMSGRSGTRASGSGDKASRT